MAVSLGFGTNNLIFVPEGQSLRVHDLYHSRVISMDVRRSAVGLRPHALADLEMRVADQLMRGKKHKETENSLLYRHAAEAFLASVREIAIDRPSPMRAEHVAPHHLTFWVRVTDEPGESFFAEDYDDVDAPSSDVAVLPIYGTFLVEEAGGLEISFPQTGPAAAFELLVPERGGLVLEDLDPLQSLPLVNEFCGTEGVSSRGASVNVSFGGEVLGNHLGCVPLRRVGLGAFATLYFSQSFEVEHRLTALLAGPLVRGMADLLKNSGFRRHSFGDKWAVFLRGDPARDADVVHLYRGLEGKESEGVRTIPSFAYVALANGSPDPAGRGAFLGDLVRTINPE